MPNELIKRPEQISITEIMTIGKAFVESGMFPDVKTAAQAVVKIQAGQEMGIAPFAAMNGINIIMGKPTVGAGIIASKVKSSGKYNYKMKEHTDKICSIDFYEGKEMIGNSTFTIEDAKKANTKNLDKFPKNMLFARAMSNGQKWFAPDVFLTAVYTPEEMENVTEDIKHEEVKTNGTTLYNHKELGTATKPLISNKAFKKACERIDKGEFDLIEKVQESFTLDATQFTIIQSKKQAV